MYPERDSLKEMNRLRLITAALLAACVTMLTGCGSDDDVAADTTAGDCLLTTAVLGTLNCYQYTKAQDGTDSAYVVTVQGYYYPLSIDHMQGRVYNADSLPVGTDLSRVVFSSFSVSGIAAIASLQDGRDSVYSYKDSTDFSVTRQISVYARNGNGKRTYDFDLRVHRENPDSFRWQKAGAAAELAGVTQARLLAVDGALTLFGRKAGRTVALRRIAGTDGAAWTVDATTMDFETPQVAVLHGQYYSLAGGALVRSADGVTWTEGEVPWNGLEDGFAADRLVAAGSGSLYVLSDGRLFGSTDGWAWAEQTLDEPDEFPDAGWAACHNISAVDGKTENLVMTGLRDGRPVVWKKVTDLAGLEHYPWMYLPAEPENIYACPALEDAVMVAYDGAAVLLGRKADGRNVILVSRDQGRTWKDNEVMLPEEMAEHDCQLAADGNSLWIADCTAGVLWTGRFNRLGWAQAK